MFMAGILLPVGRRSMARLTPSEKAAISGRMRRGIRPVEIPMSEVRPSVSRNDVMAAALLAKGVTAEVVARKLKESLEATMVVRRAVYRASGVYDHHDEIEVPDWKSRLRAVEVYFKAMGYEFQSERMMEGGVSRDIYMLVKNMTVNGKGLSEASVEELEAEHRRHVEAGLIEDGDVEAES